ncbi:MAG: bis(5'-nucleosyl)-tetraphosphatase (symmetrical) YqeK [Actinomycetota bacterium]|nr:bis(5'-nucleosyl)-tetraphosphatase (symmetrical) YqeK [Actinomycetota bacterium]
MAGPDYQVAREVLACRLGPEALAHCVGVAETAAMLAARHGVDAEDARIAGLLHDWAREDGRERLLEEANAAGIPVSDIDRTVPYLLHARLGAAAVHAEFPGLAKEVVRAIERHTLGAVDMSDLDRVVYVADLIEPGRTFEGVDDLRLAASEVSLAELYARAYEASLIHLIRTRRHLHPGTVEAWNAIVSEDTP